jgi:hypothetical protein
MFPAEQLRPLSERVLGMLQALRRTDDLHMTPYHGMMRRVMTADELAILGHHPAEIQVELLRVDRHLRHGVYRRRDSYTFSCILGEQHNFPNPRSAIAFLRNEWTPIKAGDTLYVPPNMFQGLNVGGGGQLYALSLRYITGNPNSDDFEFEK